MNDTLQVNTDGSEARPNSYFVLVKKAGNFTRQFLVRIFIVFNLAILLMTNGPNSPMTEHFLRWFRIREYMQAFTFYQQWGMFAPDPPRVVFHLEGEITFSDGSKKIWVFPQVYMQKPIKRFLMGRHIEWQRMLLFENKLPQRDMAVYLSRLYQNPQNPPVKVDIVNHWKLVPPPIEGPYQPIDDVSSDNQKSLVISFKITPRGLE